MYMYLEAFCSPTSGLHPGFWFRGGANWENEKCRGGGEVIKIIAVQMPINESARSCGGGGGRNCAQGRQITPSPP